MRICAIYWFTVLVLQCAQQKGKDDRLSRWINDLQSRRHTNVVAVALADKMVRMAWAMMTKGKDYDPDFTVC